VAVHENSVDLSFVSDLDLRYDGEPYRLTNYDVHNASAICRSILGRIGDQVILGPTSFSTMLLGAVICAVALIKQNLQSQSDAMYKLLKKGDIVLYKGKRGKYIGIGYMGETQQKIKIEFKDNLIVGIDLDQAWQLTKCASGAKRVDKYDKKIAQHSKSPRHVLTELLGFKKSEMPPALNVRLPVVASKRDSNMHYSKMSIGDRPCTSILPAGYYSREDYYERMGNDPLRREPIICFTSSIEVATNIVRNHEDANGLIVCGYRKIRGNLSHIEDLRAIGKRTVLLSDIQTIDRDDLNKLDSMDFEITAWTPSNLKKVKVGPVSSSSSSSNPLVRAAFSVRNAAHGRSERLIIESDEGDQIALIRDKLHRVSRTTSRCGHMDRFIGLAYGLLMQLTCLALSLEQLETLGYSCEPLIRRMNELLLDMYTSVPQDMISVLREILEELAICIERHRSDHPKHMAFCTAMAELDVEDCIVVRNNKYKRILGEWLAEYGESPEVLTLQQALSSAKVTYNSLSPGWYGRRHAKLRYSGFCTNEKMILYPFEHTWEDANARDIAGYMRRITVRPVLRPKATQFRPSDLEEFIDKISAEWGQSRGETSIPLLESVSEINATIVEFEEDWVAFLTEGYNCRCFNEEDETITLKKVSELDMGDVLIFVKDSSEDIFDKLTAMVKEANSEIKEQVELAEVWRHAFLSYTKSLNLSLTEFQRRLGQVGVKREVATIRTWGQKGCIGPEDDAIKAIARVTQNPELNAKLDEVMNACSQIRSLHIKLGRYLARSIVSSITGDMVLEDEPMLQQITNDLSKYAEIVTVRGMASEQARVPSNKANRLLSKFLDM
jgi:hypothetical protein